MKKTLFYSFMIFSLLLFANCDNALGTNDDHNGIPISNIRSAIYDPVINCAMEEIHQHNGIYYGIHFNNDGHGHHGLRADDYCTLNNCTQTSLHQHNGIHFAGHNNSCSHGNEHGHGSGHS